MKISYKNKKRINKFLIACFVFVTVFYMTPFNVYADDIKTSGNFYHYVTSSDDTDNYSYYETITYGGSLSDPHNYYDYALYQSIASDLRSLGLSSFIDTPHTSETNYFHSLDYIWEEYQISSCLASWYSIYHSGPMSYQLIHYNVNNGQSDAIRLVLYFTNQFSFGTGTTSTGSGIRLNALTSPVWDEDNQRNLFFYDFPLFGYTYQGSSGSFYSFDTTFHQYSVDNESYSIYESLSNTTISLSAFADTWPYNDPNNQELTRVPYTYLNSPDTKLFCYDFFIGDLDYPQLLSNESEHIYVNCFPSYQLRSSFTYMSFPMEIDFICFGSSGPINFLVANSFEGSSLSFYQNQYYYLLSSPQGNVVRNTLPVFELTYSEVTPTPSPSASPSATVTPTYIPFPTQEPYYTQMPYPTQEPYYTQMPYPTQAPYYTQMPYPTQQPYYTQIPYPSGLNNLGELTEALLTPMASPTGMPDFGFDFGLDDVSSDLNLATSLTGSSASNFFLALISILWDKGNLVFYGFFTVALGLIFIAYLLGHSRRG